jgi:hypothetical protein
MILNIDESEFEAGRIDAITIKIDRRDSGRINTVEVVKGTPSDHPVKPTLEDGNDIYYHPLAYVTVNAGVTEITDANIENCIGVNDRTPFVTGIIETINAEELIGQWQAEWNEWNDEHRRAYLDWVAQQEQDMEDWETDTKGDYETWIAEQKVIYEAVQYLIQLQGGLSLTAEETCTGVFSINVDTEKTADGLVSLEIVVLDGNGEKVSCSVVLHI